MKHISILVPEGNNNLSSIVGSYKILTRANSLWREKRGRERFQIELLGTSDQVFFHGGQFSVKTQRRISSCRRTNLIIIPSLNHHFEEAIRSNGELITWIVDQYKNGAEVASLCTGAFLLASSGLLNGRSCSTHWGFAHTFQKMFPQVRLQTDRLITDENGIYTNGGAYSFLNLLLYLVEKYFDREIAIRCSKIFQIELDRFSQSPFIIFSGMKSHDDEVIKQAQFYMEDHVATRLSIEELATKFALGRRNFDRRFVKATGLTPVEYMQRIKIEAAKKEMEVSRKNINEIMYEVGYSDTKAFRTVFRKVTGMSPLEYRSRFNKEAIF